LTSKKPNQQTYIGDEFILTFIKGDKDPLSVMSGQKALLIGFVKTTKYVMEHQTCTETPKAGVYTCLGDAVLRLDSGQIVRTSLMNLEPIGYSFDDYNQKNFNYMQEVIKHNYLGPLPYLPYNYGDKVLVAKHGRLNDDVVGVIVDTVFKGSQVFYLVECGEDTIEVAKGKIIDALELGDYAEQSRYLQQMKVFDQVMGNQIKGSKHSDEENTIDNPWIDH